MRKLKDATFLDILAHCVYCETKGKGSFDWIEETYHALCDMGLAQPMDGYKPDSSRIDKKEYDRWIRLHS